MPRRYVRDAEGRFAEVPGGSGASHTILTHPNGETHVDGQVLRYRNRRPVQAKDVSDTLFTRDSADERDRSFSKADDSNAARDARVKARLEAQRRQQSAVGTPAPGVDPGDAYKQVLQEAAAANAKLGAPNSFSDAAAQRAAAKRERARARRQAQTPEARNIAKGLAHGEKMHTESLRQAGLLGDQQKAADRAAAKRERARKRRAAAKG